MSQLWVIRSKGAVRLIVMAFLLVLAWSLSRFLAVPPLAEKVLLLAAVAIGGAPIALNAISALRNRNLTVDTLVVIAAGAAVAIGDYPEAGLVIFILLLGEFLEAATVARTSRAIEGLASLIPAAVKLKRGKQEVEIPTADVKVNDVIIVRAGERIAIDGVIARGTGTIDQGVVTGESIPVEKSRGDAVYSGTILADGTLEVRATKVGKDSTVAKIKQMIAAAQEKKAPLERTVDRFAKYFVPAVLVFAVIVYFVTFDIRRAITVLIVACPCALVLGTPTAVVAAIGAAARKGIIINGGRALEAAARINSVIFDKTGTLTHGAPSVVAVKEVCGQHEDKKIIELAAVAEKLSSHPLATAVVEMTKDWELAIVAPDDFKAKKGQGVEVRHNGLHIVVGNRSLLAENDITLCEETDDYIKSRERGGETVLIVAHGRGLCQDAGGKEADRKGNGSQSCCEKEICGIISLADTVKEGALPAIQSLQTTMGGMKIALYTGDNRRTASCIADALGIEEVSAELLPEDKTRKVEALMADGYRVAMVGDGINDAPALATADLGIAMGVVGTDIAVEAADVAILNDDIVSVPRMLKLGRKSVSVIWQNIFFALFFNAGMITLAALGLISMLMAAIFHQLSSLVVILNSMRLLRGMRKL